MRSFACDFGDSFRCAHRVRSGAYGSFPCAQGVGFIPVVRTIIFRPWGRSGPFCPFKCALSVVGCVRSIPVRPWECRVQSGASRFSCAFHPFPCSLSVAHVRSVHSPAPLHWSGCYKCVWSIPVRPGSRCVTFGPFLCSLGLV